MLQSLLVFPGALTIVFRDGMVLFVIMFDGGFSKIRFKYTR
jgi:hypothetical protein